ncbi:MAG TPA: hypothetical protein DD706_23080, partial [Nitrospiraceae bacterium]|nr:hypothetical protein [Nitrospiraceae bacterium]
MNWGSVSWLPTTSVDYGISSPGKNYMTMPTNRVRNLLRIGHRGAAGHAPENTLASLSLAIKLGVDMVEFDVRRTADGALVLLHDDLVDRTTNGKGTVENLSLSVLRELDA